MRLSLTLLVPLIVAGCFHPDFRNGGLTCSDNGMCPSGFMCSKVDNHCYRPGASPTPMRGSDLPDAGEDAGPNAGQDASQDINLPGSVSPVTATPDRPRGATVAWTAA